MENKWLLVMLAASFLINTVVVVHGEERVRFDGHQVWRFAISEPAQRMALANVVVRHGLDVWAEHPSWVDVMVPAEHKAELAALDLPFEVSIEDLQALIDQERLFIEQVSPKSSRGSCLKITHGGISVQAAPGNDFFTTYRTLEEFNRFLDDLTTGYAHLVTKHTIGRTVEQRAINGITITSNKKPHSNLFSFSLSHSSF